MSIDDGDIMPRHRKRVEIDVRPRGSGEEDHIPYDALVAVGLDPEAGINLQRRLHDLLPGFSLRILTKLERCSG